MKARSQREPSLSGELMSFTREGAIPIKDVEQALTGLWRQASSDLKAQKGTGLTRACLWNLVAYHTHPRERPGHAVEDPERLEHLLMRVTTSVPARVMHLEQWAAEQAPSAGKEVEAWVSSTCLLHERGPQVLCCEEIHVAGYGEKGHFHFPALVRALLVPGLPVALLWMDDVPRRGRMLGQLLRLCDRLLIDTQHTTRSDSLIAVRDLMRSTSTRVVDLGWMRLTPVRYLVAEFFDTPERTRALEHLEEVAIETNPHGRNAGLLLLGWLLSRVGCTEVRAVDLGEGQNVSRWQVKHGSRKVTVNFGVRQGDGGLDGIFSLELKAGGDTFALRDVDPEHMSVWGPDRQLPKVRLHEWDEVGLIVEGLGGHAGDPIYGEALEKATQLVESEQWNQ